jgi:hypothetical protein
MSREFAIDGFTLTDADDRQFAIDGFTLFGDASAAVTLTPPNVTGSASAIAPSIAAGVASIAPPAATGSSTVVAPSITLGAVTLTPPAIAVSTSVVEPGSAVAQTITPPTLTGSASAVEPTVSFGGDPQTVAPPAIAASTWVFGPVSTDRPEASYFPRWQFKPGATMTGIAREVRRKRANESITRAIDFTNRMVAGDSIASLDGLSVSPTTVPPLVVTSPTVAADGARVLLDIAGGLDGVLYSVAVAVRTTPGLERREGVAKLHVDDG